VHLDLNALRGMDHTTAEMLNEWISRRRKTGGTVKLSGPEIILKPLAA